MSEKYRGLPSIYQQVEYIQSSGTQWIDADLSVDSYGNNEMVVSLEYTDVTTAQLFGANNDGYFGVKSGADYNVSSVTIAVNTPYTYNIKRSGGKYTRILNGTSYSNGSISARATTSVYLFAIAEFTSLSYTKCKVKHFEYYVDNVLVRDLVPCFRKSDSVAGMYDLVNNTFYTNAGTGTFSVGPNVKNPYKIMFPIKHKSVPYERLEYIQSSGSQYINSGVNTGTNIKLDYEYEATAYNGSNFCAPIAARVSATSNSISHGFNSNSTYFGFGNNSEFSLSPYFTLNTRYHIVQDKTAVYVNDVKKTYPSTQTTTFTTLLNLYLFARNNNGSVGNYFWGKIYYVKIYNNDELVRNFIPVRRKSDNVICMYDLVENKFYTNSGSGTFTAGPVIEEVEYVEGTGTQYINTGLKGNLNTAIELKFEGITSAANDILNVFGDITTSSKAISCNTGYTDDAARPTSRFGDKSTGGVPQRLTKNTPYIITSNKNNYTIKNQDGTTYRNYAYNATTAFTTTNNLWVFVCNSNNAPSTYSGGSKFYYCKIWDNNVLVRNFIPIKVGTEYAMFDKVTQNVYRNAGTGSFTGGNVVQTTTNTTCFVVSPIYPGYTPIEYLQTDGESWIDTGIIGDLNTAFQIKAQAVNINRQEVLFGSRASASSRVISVIFPANTDLKACAVDFGNYSQTRIIPTDFNANSVLEIYNSKDYRYVKDLTTGNITEATTTYSTSFTTPTNLYIAHKTSGFVSDTHFNFKGKIFYCKIWENNILVRNFIPVKRNSDNVLGMYDTVNKIFYTNAGTGNFTAGNVKSAYKFKQFLTKG